MCDKVTEIPSEFLNYQKIATAQSLNDISKAASINAKIRRTMMDSYISEGFTEDQAFDLVKQILI